MTPPPQDDQTQIAQAIQDVTEKAQILVREEIALAKAEIETKVRSLVKGGAVAAAAGLFVLVALMFILQGFAWLLYYLLPLGSEFAYFWGFFTAAAIFLLIAVVAGLIGLRWIKKGAPPVPEMAIDEAKLIRETVQSPDPKSTL